MPVNPVYEQDRLANHLALERFVAEFSTRVDTGNASLIVETEAGYANIKVHPFNDRLDEGLYLLFQRSGLEIKKDGPLLRLKLSGDFSQEIDAITARLAEKKVIEARKPGAADLATGEQRPGGRVTRPDGPPDLP